MFKDILKNIFKDSEIQRCANHPGALKKYFQRYVQKHFHRCANNPGAREKYFQRYFQRYFEKHFRIFFFACTLVPFKNVPLNP